MTRGTEAPSAASAGQAPSPAQSPTELLQEAGALERSGAMQGAVDLIHLAQILCVVDVYDALTTTRSYRPALSHEAAVAQMLECRSWWRSDVFARFLDAVPGPAA